jgi:hypothetical protein
MLARSLAAKPLNELTLPSANVALESNLDRPFPIRYDSAKP